LASQFEREIHQQPGAVERLLTTGREDVARIADHVRAFDPHFVMIAARGTSDNAARYAQYLFGAHNRLPVALATPSLFTLYHSPPRLYGALVIGISQSGASPDIVAVLAEARAQGALTLALTNEPDSALAKAAELCLELRAGDERAVAATKTYTNQLVALAMLSATLQDDRERQNALERLPDQMTEALRLNGEIRQLSAEFAGSRQFVVIGRGYNYATAFEIALKIKETSYVVAEAYSSAEFLHGPIAVVDEGFPALVIAPSGTVYDDVEALHDVLAERQAKLVAISDRSELLDGADAPLPLPADVPEWISPVVAVVPGQIWALELARAKGIDPDQPRGLTKVTRTR
jgi:glucosamine--fructose-6-phosphate aminotransferase (isomerizing)